MNELVKYMIVGLINTAIGYGVFWTLLHWVGCSPELANAFGYAIALCVAFYLNRIFVFSGANSSTSSMLRFFVAFAAAFLLNQAVLIVSFRVFLVPAEIAQVFAMVVYTIIFYLLNKFYVFRALKPSRSGEIP